MKLPTKLFVSLISIWLLFAACGPTATPTPTPQTLPTSAPDLGGRTPTFTPAAGRILMPLYPLEGDAVVVEGLPAEEVLFDWTATAPPYRLTLTRVNESTAVEEITGLMADSVKIQISFQLSESELSWIVTDDNGDTFAPIAFFYSVIIPRETLPNPPSSGPPVTEVLR